ncbi:MULTISPECIES: efflux transporter outer membrane subunit [unclassified Sulfurospirillum]|uniref:efflux transporter outer membrane subunit n=1 Tax=unclassified Sulfurospirillum TaxID=2618290 RepID=UPI000507DDB4|nr:MULTISPECIES: efflux transporter outer membrane subunit [unclassified Sulfurospirillum]KFL33588.1 transporter [Sulfurospirillum sp. SCADC]
MHFLSLVLAPFLLSGCVSLAPDYVRPTAPIPATLHQEIEQHQSAVKLPWRDFIQESRLQKVVALSLEQSRDMRKAVANIEAARATYRIAKSSELPTIEASASGSKARALNSATNQTSITQSSSATVGVNSYELDFFGKIKSQTQMQWESFQSVEEAARAVQISLIAEVSTAWLSLASDQSLLALAQKTEASANRSVAIVEARLQRGIDSRVALYEAQSVLHQARADSANYASKVAQDCAALELLVGASLDDTLLPQTLESGAEGWLSDVSSGLSSDILLNRPDVLEAEHNLKSANANIGVARAAYFPSITLTGTAGVGSNALRGLFDGGTSTIWSFAPNVSLPLFDAGERDATLDYAKANLDVYVASYELAIQTAFKEVRSALARRATMNDQLQAQRAFVDASTKSYAIYDARYQNGVDTFLNALLAQRSMYAGEQNLISVRLEALLNRVTLYQVLGGGLAQKSD